MVVCFETPQGLVMGSTCRTVKEWLNREAPIRAQVVIFKTPTTASSMTTCIGTTLKKSASTTILPNIHFFTFFGLIPGGKFQLFLSSRQTLSELSMEDVWLPNTSFWTIANIT